MAYRVISQNGWGVSFHPGATKIRVHHGDTCSDIRPGDARWLAAQLVKAADELEKHQ